MRVPSPLLQRSWTSHESPTTPSNTKAAAPPSNSNMHQYQRTPCSSKANTPPFHVCSAEPYFAIIIEVEFDITYYECAIVIRVYYKHQAVPPCFKFKHAPIATYFLYFQSQHDTVPCHTFINQNQRRAMCHRHYSGVGHHMSHFLLHWTVSSTIFKFKHTPIIPTYALFVQSQHRSINIFDQIKANPEPCIIAINIVFEQHMCVCAIAVSKCTGHKEITTLNSNMQQQY